MTDGHRAALHVDLRGIEAQVAIHSECLHTEGLVQLEQIHAIERPTRLCRRFAHGFDGRQSEPLRRAAAGGLGANHSQRHDAQFSSPRGAGDHQGRGAVAHAGRVARGHCAFRLKSRLKPGKDFDGSLRADRFVGIEEPRFRSFFGRRNLDGQNLFPKETLRRGRSGAAVRLGRKSVLLLAADAVAGRDLLRAHAHMEVVVDLPEAVLDHRIHQRAVAHAIAAASLGQQIGRVGHRLHAAGDDHFGVFRLDGLRGQGHGLQARTADLVDGERGYLIGQSAVDRGLARRSLAETGLQNAAHDALVHGCRFNARPAHRLAYRKRAQPRRGKRLERALKPAHRDTRC